MELVSLPCEKLVCFSGWERRIPLKQRDIDAGIYYCILEHHTPGAYVTVNVLCNIC